MDAPGDVADRRRAPPVGPASEPSDSECTTAVLGSRRAARYQGTRTEDTAMANTPEKPFLTDVTTLRRRAREHIMQGAVTSGYTADRETVLKLLNEALATEIVCVLRYKRHYFMADGIAADAVKAEFLQHANEEQQHADQIAARIVQLNGEPNLNPEGLTSRSHAEYVEGEDLIDMIKEDLVAERIAIDSYRDMINYIGDKDTTTKRMLESILAMEEEHADDLVGLLEKMDK
jgi:bacterioferritin